MSETDEQIVSRMRWKCRRGMLELDFLLEKFINEKYLGLNSNQRIAFERLLEEQDPILLRWFMEQETPEDTDLAAMVQLIIEK